MEKKSNRGRRKDAEGVASDQRNGELSLIKAIHEIAKKNARADINNEYHLLLYLRSWWSNRYNRPLKDPLLLSYTLEELLYEYYDYVERRTVKEEVNDQENDRIEEEQFKANLDWAEQEELKELKTQQTQQAQQKELTNEEIAQKQIEDPNNQEWMKQVIEKELKEGKQIYGDDYGEDIEEDFE